MQSFVALLACESVDQSTFCMKLGSTSYKKCTSANALQSNKNTKNAFNADNYVINYIRLYLNSIFQVFDHREL